MAKGEGWMGGTEEVKGVGIMIGRFSGIEPIRKIMSVRARSGKIE